MKKIFKQLLFVLTIFGGLFFSYQINQTLNVYADSGPNQVTIHFFYDVDCQNCQKEQVFLDKLMTENDNLSLEKYDIAIDDNLTLLNEVAHVFDESRASTPFTIIGGKYFSGFNQAIETRIVKTVNRYASESYVDIMAKILNDEPILATDFDVTSDYEYYLPILGTIDIRNASLIVISMVLGFLDGINPCAMWVLIFLITLVINSKDKKRIWYIAGLFILTSAIFYFLLMMAWLETIHFLIAKQAFQIIIGIFALLAGGYNIYSFIKAKIRKTDGCEVETVTSKNKLIAKAQKIVNASSLPLAIVGIITLAIMVNGIELACSSGFPLLFTQILALNNVSRSASIGYILLYILLFLIDDIIIFLIAIFTFKISPLSSKIAKYSHLIGGLLMITIGILMIFFPHILMFSFF